jgi:hypothetical protein
VKTTQNTTQIEFVAVAHVKHQQGGQHDSCKGQLVIEQLRGGKGKCAATASVMAAAEVAQSSKHSKLSSVAHAQARSR